MKFIYNMGLQMDISGAKILLESFVIQQKTKKNIIGINRYLKREGIRATLVINIAKGIAGTCPGYK